jgi:glucose-1-phosphate thymidylyltransferase
MKGLIMAGGSGTRLYPATLAISKQLLPIYDKPMIYYSLSALLLAGARDIMLISTPTDLPMYERLLGDGSQFGIRITYAPQILPGGIAQGILIAENFIADDRVCMVLGDNIFYGQGLTERLRSAANSNVAATIFGYRVRDPERYGVMELDSAGKVIGLEEKPKVPKSNYAVVGLYFYDSSVVDVAKRIVPSSRGELEITDINRYYLDRGQLTAELFGRGIAWLDTGTHSAMHDASSFIEAIEKRQGLKVACLEEIAYENGFISINELSSLADRQANTDYGKYLAQVVIDARS